MIRNDSEYRETQRRLEEQEHRLREQAAQLKQIGLSKEEINRVLDPARCLRDQLREETDEFERLQQGDFSGFRNLSGIGRLLIAVRIAKKITQRELAERLAVSESQVSRDERNEYHGVTIDRANRILEALGVEVRTTVESLG